jgi:hypothetical protein
MDMKKAINKILAVAAGAVMAFSCSADMEGIFDGWAAKDGGYDYDGAEGMSEPSGTGEGENNGNTNAGLLTAGEWNDLDNWQFWGQLMLSQGDGKTEEVEDGEWYEGDGSFYQYCPHWGFYTNNRVAVKVTNEGAPAAGVNVILSVDNTPVWTAVTDNLGMANCWINLYTEGGLSETAKLSIKVGGIDQPEAPVVTKWSSEETVYNEYEVPNSFTARTADIAFFVDATGSMGDEIDFLKSDLIDIFKKVEKLQSGTEIRTAALFYRDDGDEYVTKQKDFTKDIKSVSDYVGKQSASGGGDFPEAVHSALEAGLQNLSWNEGARSKIAFMLLDAPAHHNLNVINSLHKSIEMYAKKGIKIIPVAASGVDKNTEFMLRFFAIATGGTYVFLTNDSGIGGDHIQASVGEYEVEQLNDLIVRLIDKYLE